MSFQLCDGTGETRVPCMGCIKYPCEAMKLLKEAESWLNEQSCSMALDFGVTYCIHCDSELNIITLVGEAHSGGFISRIEAEEILTAERVRLILIEPESLSESGEEKEDDCCEHGIIGGKNYCEDCNSELITKLESKQSADKEGEE